MIKYGITLSEGRDEKAGAERPLRLLTDTVIVSGATTTEGATRVERNRYGRFTTPASAAAIDETVTVLATVLKSLANK